MQSFWSGLQHKQLADLIHGRSWSSKYISRSCAFIITLYKCFRFHSFRWNKYLFLKCVHYVKCQVMQNLLWATCNVSLYTSTIPERNFCCDNCPLLCFNFRVSDEILEECLLDIAKELEDINSEIVNHVYRAEFNEAKSPSSDEGQQTEET